MTFIRAGEPAKSDYVYYAELERDFRVVFFCLFCAIVISCLCFYVLMYDRYAVFFSMCCADLEKIKGYIDSFRYGAPPHAGGGIGQLCIFVCILVSYLLFQAQSTMKVMSGWKLVLCLRRKKAYL